MSMPLFPFCCFGVKLAEHQMQNPPPYKNRAKVNRHPPPTPEKYEKF